MADEMSCYGCGKKTPVGELNTLTVDPDADPLCPQCINLHLILTGAALLSERDALRRVAEKFVAWHNADHENGDPEELQRRYDEILKMARDALSERDALRRVADAADTFAKYPNSDTMDVLRDALAAVESRKGVDGE